MNELREKLQEEPLINNIKEEVDNILLNIISEFKHK